MEEKKSYINYVESLKVDVEFLKDDREYTLEEVYSYLSNENKNAIFCNGMITLFNGIFCCAVLHPFFRHEVWGYGFGHFQKGYSLPTTE